MANSTILYACTDSGLFIYNKPGTLPEWLPPRTALDGMAVRAVWASAGPPITVSAAVSGTPGTDGSAGVFRSENGGREWTHAFEADATSILGSDLDPVRLYVGLATGGLATSVDGGTTWGVLPDTGASTVRRILTGEEEGPLYILAGDLPEGSLLEGRPEDGDWRTLTVSGVAALARDTANGDLYAACTDGVQMSADKGATWALLPGSPEGGVSIAAIPGPQEAAPAILVGTARGLTFSPDGGMSWEDADVPGGGVNFVARDPERRDRVYIATNEGFLFESGDRGRSWQPVNSTPLAPVHFLHVLRI